jgi:hypothetical protein
MWFYKNKKKIAMIFEMIGTEHRIMKLLDT